MFDDNYRPGSTIVSLTKINSDHAHKFQESEPYYENTVTTTQDDIRTFRHELYYSRNENNEEFCLRNRIPQLRNSRQSLLKFYGPHI